MNRKLIVLPLAALALAGCSTVSTNPDQAGLHYSGGSFSSTKFSNCVESGSRAWDGPGDKHYVYPAGQRTFAFGEGDNQDSAPLSVAAGNVQLTAYGVARFELDTDCKVLQQFHEKIGGKFGVSTDGGDYNDVAWRKLIGTYVLQPLQRAMADAAADPDVAGGADQAWVALYNDPAAKARWEKRVGELLPEYVKQVSGGDYFRNFSVTLQKPGLPEALQQSLQKLEQAIRDQQTQVETNKTLELERQGIQGLVDQLGPEGFNVYTALKDGKVTVMPIPQGSSVIVDQPQAAK